MESGYGLVNEEGRPALLDHQATPQVVSVLRASHRQYGIKLRVTREHDSEVLQTVEVKEIE